MPNIRRTFPGDDKSSDEEDDSPQIYHRGGGKQLIRGGGKQLVRGGGKYLQPPQADEDDESSSEEEEEAPPQQQVYSRGGGKQLRPSGGKNFRPAVQTGDDESDDEELDDDDDDEVEEALISQTVRVVNRGGGKNFSRMTAPQPEDDESEEEEEEEPAPVQRVMPRSGGKMLSRMQPPPVDESSSDEEMEDVEEPLVKPVQRVVGGGKTLVRNVGGGKQLRRIEPEEDDAPPKATSIIRSPAGGKQLRRPEPDEERSLPTSISRSQSGGKQLRRPEPEEAKNEGSTISRSPSGGKQLRRPEPEEEKPKPKPQISRSPGGGKQLRRQAKEESEEDEDEDELFGDDDEDDDEDDESDYEEAAVKKKPTTRPRRGAARKAIIEDDEVIGDDDVSSDDEHELDINNTEALIKDEDDRKYLDSLPELEREAILGDRFEKAKAEQDMKKAIREAKLKEQASKGTSQRKQTKKANKKSQPDKDAELAQKLSGRRESTRDKDAKGAKSKKAAALAALKKEKKIQKQRDESEDSEIDFADDSDEDSDDDYDDGDGDLMPWQKKAKASKPPKPSVLDKEEVESDEDSTMDLKGRHRKPSSSTPVVEASVEDFKKCTVPRRRLARWCGEPFFEAAVLNCFVRVFIGENDSGEKVYRLCEITDVKVGIKVYKFPIAKRGDKPVMTNKMITLRFGKHEKDFPMSLVSDAQPDELDVKKYISVMRNIREELLTKREANKLARLQHELVHNYRYTTEDIEKNLQQRKKQGKKLGNFGAELTKAAIAVQAARDSVKEAERNLAEAKRSLIEDDDINSEKAVQDASESLKAAENALEEKISEERAMLDVVENRKKLLAQRAKDRNWAKVNKRAMEANQKADREANKPSETKGNGSNKKEAFNPYARRKVKPKILWEVGQDDEKEGVAGIADEEEATDPTAKIDSTATPTLVHETDNKIVNGSETHQFSIDEEDLAQTSGSALFGSAKVGRKRKRRGISLTVYLERKADGKL